ncbi:MAG: hypothetical protein IJ057_03865, partial [Bacteroidales bacterium]|nr:hypothetical protein [Bacteroidales bacterium]
YAEGAGKVQALTNIVHNNNLELDQRRRALDELKKIVPGYHADLTEEGRLIKDNTEALSNYLKNLEKVTRQKILQEEYEKTVAEVMEAEKDVEDAKNNTQSALQAANGNTATYKTVTRYNARTGESFEARGRNTPYGDALEAENKAQDELDKKKALQLEIEKRINNEFGIRAGKVSDENAEIRKVNESYDQLFNEIREQYRDNPTAGNERIEQLKEQQRAEIAEIRKNAKEKRTVETDETSTTNAVLTQAQFDYLQERQDKLTKKEKEMVGKGYAALSEEESKVLAKRYAKLMKADGNAANKRYQEQVRQLKEQLKTQEKEYELSFAKNEISEFEYDAKIYAARMENFRLRLEAARQFGQDETAIMNEFLDMQIKAVEKQQKEEEKILDAFAKVKRDKVKKEEEKEKQRILNSAKSLAKEQEILEQNLADAKELMNESHWKEEYDFQKWKLDQLHDLGWLSERDYQEALLNLRLSYAQKAAELVGEVASQASNFVSSLKDAELAKAEANYQAELTAAGSNAEQREAIEQAYQKKQLEIQKKYADVEMVITIAKTVANGAAAAIRAYFDGGPYAGPILAALIAATTAAEVATIVQQRNAIKSSSVNSTGSSNYSDNNVASTDNGNIGSRVITGYAKGGFTEGRTTLTTVGEKGTEWIAPNWMVRSNPILFANLEHYRNIGSHGRSGSVTSGFAEGGFAPSSPSDGMAVDGALLAILKDLKQSNEQLTRQLAQGIHADVALSEINRKQEILNKFRQKTSAL